jgi:hypothetical protein
MPPRNRYRLILAREPGNQAIVNECLRLSVLLMLADEMGYADSRVWYPNAIFAVEAYRTQSPEGRSWGYFRAAHAYAQLSYMVTQHNRPASGALPHPVFVPPGTEVAGGRVKYLSLENHKCLDEFFAIFSRPSIWPCTCRATTTMSVVSTLCSGEERSQTFFLVLEEVLLLVATGC